jgi:putative flippase GtrA
VVSVAEQRYAILKTKVFRQVGRFAALGVARAVFSYVLYLALLQFSPYWLSFTVAYGVTVLLSMVINGAFVFGTRLTKRRALAYFINYGISYAVSLSLLNLFVGVVGFYATVAPIAVVALTFPLNFLLERYALAR